MISIAVVGAGSMAREHIRAFTDRADVRITGIASRTRSKAEALAKELKIPHVFDGIDAMHEATRADLVIVAVPELSARSVAEECFQFPWSVLLEKPAGYNLADAERIMDAGRGRKVYVGLNRRCLGSTRAVLTDVGSRSEPRFIVVQDQQSLDTAKQIGHPPAVVDHWMYANSIHLVDYLLCFGRGAVTDVRIIYPYDPRGGVMLASIDFASGDRGIYQGVWSGPGPWAVTVQTDSRRWELRPLESAQFQNAGERKLNTAPVYPWDQDFKPGFRRQAEEVLVAIQGQPSTAVTLEQSLETMRLIHRIFGR